MAGESAPIRPSSERAILLQNCRSRLEHQTISFDHVRFVFLLVVFVLFDGVQWPLCLYKKSYGQKLGKLLFRAKLKAAHSGPREFVEEGGEGKHDARGLASPILVHCRLPISFSVMRLATR